MSLMGGVMAAQAAKGLIDSFRGIAQGARQPKPREDFASLLQAKLAEARGMDGADRRAAAAERLTDRAFRLGDANGDGFLDRNESGLDAGLFARLDTDGDGRLSRDEVRAQARAIVDAAHARATRRG